MKIETKEQIILSEEPGVGEALRVGGTAPNQNFKPVKPLCSKILDDSY